MNIIKISRVKPLTFVILRKLSKVLTTKIQNVNFVIATKLEMKLWKHRYYRK